MKKSLNSKYKKFLIRIVVYWIPVLIWAGLIFILSSYPTKKTSQIHWQDFIVKKTAHIIEYFILTTLLYRAYINSNMDKSKALYLSFFSVLFYGITDEIHQAFTPGREPRVRDMLIDGIGSLLAVYSINSFIPKLSKYKKLFSMVGLMHE